MRKTIYILAAAVVITAGCRGPKSAGESAETAFIHNCTVEEAMQLSRDVLNRMYFNIDKYDVDKGVIITEPLRGGQFFELWRSDNADGSAKLDSNIHNLVRTVSLDLAKEQKGVRISCISNVKRLSMPGREAYSVSQTGMLYSKRGKGTNTLVPKDEYSWIDLGRDKALETRITEQINNAEKTEK
ncbi:hypothetical protein SMSP2_00340 [Limihaloglobus sulfuriphilus]|uniref:Lipoprotein n=1 Tax=Limihaloglobus sulfuriphilus TaxID=1851148 RepID=A0A1Q2MBA4_9BACT|nr:hypothetical protein [Limihaloglobus sulfuriphilus]AQQ70003.1 hypothetical protein SMSP2_00340 [Limihaloglobus sulfuriphilus]